MDTEQAVAASNAPVTAAKPRLPLWPAIVLVGVLASVPLMLADRGNTRPCWELSTCMGQGITSGLAFLSIGPLLLIGMLIAGFPRRDYWLLLVAPVLTGCSLAAVLTGRRWVLDFTVDGHPPAAPALVWVLATTAPIVASWIAVRLTPTPRWWRIIAPVTVLALALGIVWGSREAEHAKLVRQIAAVPVTLYRPTLPNTTLHQAAANQNPTAVSLYYQGTSYATVYLIPLAGSTPCQTIRQLNVYGLDEKRCTGDEFTSTDGSYAAAMLRRGDTVLAASAHSPGLTPEQLLEALRNAPTTDAATLAR